MTYKSKTPGYANHYSKLYRSGYRTTVDAAPLIRRARALQAIGYTRAQMAEEFGTHRSTIIRLLSGNLTLVRRPLANQITAAYERLHMTPQTSTSAKRVMAHAVKSGYAPPLAFEDIDLGITARGWARK